MTGEVDRFPMPVRQFLAEAETHLQRGDIVLCKGKASLYSWAIRYWTKSEFSHAALVFAVPSREDGFERTFLIEAGTSGVDITDLGHYVIEFSRVYDVAIKRLERPWMTVDVQRAVRGHMLNFIKASYDYSKVAALLRSLVSNAIFGLSAGVVGVEKAVKRSMRWSRTPPARFLCSGFVQFGFVSAVRQLVSNGALERRTIGEVVFKPGLSAEAGRDALLATTPEDFARSDRLSWKFAVRRGHVYRVESYDCVKAILARR